ncbi:uncharacterized protein K02A2.6-like [Octopus bimaculoides]|uniref:uncharacterized protein K02A2.6-like n=1 Tax=Octopus bimaculoides TaxID=37653 RepID=UPI00071D132D|nr:uncharacterized protein K02A2.6-like [Octopus bimaculoides]|eukprot:XP_014775588.1 PREDICTED: uncharacterized protein K02A2.6-like [Octopus bimaculoides]
MVRELPVTLEDIKRNAKKDKFVTEMKRMLWTGKVNKNRIGAKRNQDMNLYSIYDGVLRYAQRVVIPETLQKKMLREFHDGYSSSSRVKALMRSYVYWPKMDREIKNLVKGCRGRALATKLSTIRSEPWPKVDVPWSRLHTDFAAPLNGSYYIEIVDNFFKWPENCKCKKPTSSTTTNFLHELFARFSVPDTIVSDNGTQFVSFEFKQFHKMFAVEHVTMAPYHPRSKNALSIRSREL